MVGGVALKLVGLVVLVVALSVVPGAVTHASAPTDHPTARAAPVKAARSCGHVRAGHGYKLRFRITIEYGRVRCGKARGVLRKFLNGGGVMHGPKDGPHARQYWAIGHWKCGYGTGGGACIRHGRTYRTARDYILAQS